jgi:hypothetical protein
MSTVSLTGETAAGYTGSTSAVISFSRPLRTDQTVSLGVAGLYDDLHHKRLQATGTLYTYCHLHGDEFKGKHVLQPAGR